MSTVHKLAPFIMVSVFGGFIFSQSTMIRSIGFGLAFGVLLDAFVVRMLLMPALMHLLGRSIKVEVDPGTPRERTILDIKVWDFDNQVARQIKPVSLQPGETVKVTCRHVQWLRDRLPAFRGQPERYVVWGEGTTDEMCLGILTVTRP